MDILRENISSNIIPKVRDAVMFGKTNRKRLGDVTNVTRLGSCDFSCNIYREKHSRLLPASSHVRESAKHHRQTAPGPPTPTYLVSRTLQSTSKTGPYNHSWTHDDGPPPRALSFQTEAGAWRRCATLGRLEPRPALRLALCTRLHVLTKIFSSLSVP